MSKQLLALLAALALTVSSTATASAQATPRHANNTEPVSGGRPLSAWIADLKSPAAQIRNAAAYEIASMGPKAKAAVPALIDLLDDPEASVRMPATVALLEIGPAAADAIPALEKVGEDDINDDVAAGARRAIKHIRPARDSSAAASSTP
jgi:HEAT repeat protein